jgi:hypothetical protein
LLKVAHLADEHCVANMNIGGGWIESGFDSKRFTGLLRAFELSPKLVFGNAIDRPFPKEV